MGLSQQEGAGLIKFKTAEIEINLVGSLVARSLRFSSIKIDGSKILVTNSPIDGFLFKQIPTKKLLNLPEIATKQAVLGFKNINMELPFRLEKKVIVSPNGSSMFIFLKPNTACLVAISGKFSNFLVGICLNRKPSIGELVTRILLPSILIELKRSDLATSEPTRLISISAVLNLIRPAPSC
jgi:hypothetical protein